MPDVSEREHPRFERKPQPLGEGARSYRVIPDAFRSSLLHIGPSTLSQRTTHVIVRAASGGQHASGLHRVVRESWGASGEDLSFCVLVEALLPPESVSGKRTVDVQQLFKRTFEARGRDRERCFAQAIASEVEPHELFDAAKREFAQYGNQDRLELAARLLNAMGQRAGGALSAIAKNPFEGQEVFVDLIAESEIFSAEHRKQLLRAMAVSSNVDTRHRVLQVAVEIDPELSECLLRLLIEDSDPEISEAAKHKVAALHERK